MNVPFPIPTGLHPSAESCLPSEVLWTKEDQPTLWGTRPEPFRKPQRGGMPAVPT
jgi:hypothetical protein